MSKRIVSLSITIIILMISLGSGNAHAWTDTQNYIRDPSNIPRFENYSVPTLAPGDSGTLSFAIKNRYNDSIDQSVLTIEIFRVQTIDYVKDIKNAADPPRISDAADKQVLVLSLNRISSGDTLVKPFTISTSTDTEEGTYSVRFNLTFMFQSSKYTMLSRGYFSDSDWDYATKGSPNVTQEEVGIDMGYLYWHYGSIAIIPETAFTVRSPIPMWPLYLLVALTILFAAMAVVFYLQEEHNKFPRLEKGLQKLTGKFYQSRRFFKKRSGKVGGKV
jgi:hypothetical protein